MTARKYTLITPERVANYAWYLHKVGCKAIKADLSYGGGTKEVITLDLSASDEVIMEEIDIDDLGYTLGDVKIHSCVERTNGQVKGKRVPAKAPVAKPVKDVPLTKPKKNGAAQDAAAKKAQKIIEDLIEKIVAARGKDDVGEGDEWADQRKDTCNDYVYDLAVEVRKLREGGEAWWRIAQILMLPGAGASATQGKTGAAYARRIWERAWGPTWKGEKAPRDTKERRQERALTEAHRPYFSEADEPGEIVMAVSGKVIHWVTRLGNDETGIVASAQEAAVLPNPKLIWVKEGPKGRYLEFFEAGESDNPHIQISGPRRSVYLDRITRVGA